MRHRSTIVLSKSFSKFSGYRFLLFRKLCTMCTPGNIWSKIFSTLPNRYKCKIECSSSRNVQRSVSSRPYIFDKVVEMYSGKCISKAKLHGKVAVVTGCNTGIGKETVMDLYKRGARVIMACRDMNKAEKAMEDIKQTCSNENNTGSLSITKLDLNSLKSVRECAEEILKKELSVNILINNAGVMMCPQGKTEDGFETQFGTNHLAHFLLTNILLPRIIDSKPSRIINVSSKAHAYGVINFEDINFERIPYSPLIAYNQSKLANVLFSRELAKRLKENNIDGVNVYSLHPGVITTELGRHINKTLFPGVKYVFKFLRLFFKTPYQGAQTTIYCAVDEKCENETGLYYVDCAVKTPGKNALDKEAAEKLWDMSVKMVALDSLKSQ